MPAVDPLNTMAHHHRRHSDAALLAQLQAVTEERREAHEILRALTLRRDLLIFALYRRGVSLRGIAAAAGLHFTRVRQLVNEADRVTDEAGLKPMKGKKARRPTST